MVSNSVSDHDILYGTPLAQGLGMADKLSASMTIEDDSDGINGTSDMLCLLNDLNIDALIASLDDAPDAEAPAPSAAVIADERRVARRWTPSELGADLKLTMPNVTDLALVNISETGVLIETRKRLNPGTPTDLFVQLNGKKHATRATVVRSNLHAIKSGVVYRAALRFEKGLPIEARP